MENLSQEKISLGFVRKRVLYFTKYSRLGASSRMRSFQYFPYLAANGIDVTARPLFGDNYLKGLYNGNSSLLLIVKAYLMRLLMLFTVFKYDKVVIEKELFPYLPAWAEWCLKIFSIKYIVDYDDAIFHNYDLNPRPLFRDLMGDKIDKVMRYSHVVIAGNSYLAARAVKAGAKNVNVLPTVIDLSRYALKEHTEHKPVVIGWIGTKSTFEKHFTSIKGLITQVLEKYDVVFHVVGVTDDLGLGNKVKYFDWTEETEVGLILNFDIGIMPLKDSEWEKGKCAYKLIQYMGCGLPVIASPVGMNNEVVIEGENGFLASDEKDWLTAIEKYITALNIRKEHGFAGRKLVTEKYCLEVTQDWLLKILQYVN